MTIEFRCAKCLQLLRVPRASVGKNARCPKCRLLMRIPVDDSALSMAAEPTDGRPGLPWEQSSGSAFGRFWRTATLVTFRPTTAFEHMRQRGGYASPLVYSMLGIATGSLANLVWSAPLTYLQFQLFPASAEILRAAVVSNLLMTLLTGIANVLLGATVGNFVSAAVLHVCLLGSGGGKHGFDTSFRICAFVQGSLAWLQWIPLVGSVATFAWSIAVSIIAVHKAHEVSVGRACLIVLLPLFVCAGLVCVVAAIFVSSILALLSRSSFQ